MTPSPPPTHQLLDAYPRVRARSVVEASERVGRLFSPHRLELRGDAASLDVRHNRFQLCELSINVLNYGTEVLIDPGERGDFFLVQLPLQGLARLSTGRCEIELDSRTLSVLQPQTRSRMTWSGDCSMILVQVPRASVVQRAERWDLPAPLRMAHTRPRDDAAVGGWWQAVLDITHNIDRLGDTWLRQPAAAAAVEELLLSAFTTLLQEPQGDAAASRGADARCLRRARDFIVSHADRALTLEEIARHACVSPRTLEAVFRRNGHPAPLAYARLHRLQQVHERLRAARAEGQPVNVTQVALEHGFVHMGRFAAQYRSRFGVPPSHTLRASH